MVEIAGMSPRDERAMLRERCPWLPDKLVRRAVKFAAKVRQSDGQNVAVLPDFSTRELLNWCEKCMQYRDPLMAASMTFLPLVEDENTRGALRDAIHAIVGRRIVIAPPAMKTPTTDRPAMSPEGLRGSAALLDPANPNREAEFLAVLEARAKGLSWQAIERGLVDLRLAPRNGMTAWEVVNKAPTDLVAQFADRVTAARKPAK